MSFTDEDRLKGGQATKKHGLYAIKSRGPEALDADQRQTLRDIQESLSTPEGVRQALLERVSMGMMVMSVLENYLEEMVNSGMPLDSIPILKSWPAFQNSAVRALAQLRATMPKQQADGYAEALERINRVIDEHEQDPSDAVVPDDLQTSAAPQGATGEARSSHSEEGSANDQK